MEIRNVRTATDVPFSEIEKLMEPVDILYMVNGVPWQIVKIPGFNHSELSNEYAFPKDSKPTKHDDLFPVTGDSCVWTIEEHSSNYCDTSGDDPKIVQRNRVFVLRNGWQFKVFEVDDTFEETIKDAKEFIRKVNRIPGISETDHNLFREGTVIRYLGFRAKIVRYCCTEAQIEIVFIDSRTPEWAMRSKVWKIGIEDSNIEWS